MTPKVVDLETATAPPEPASARPHPTTRLVPDSPAIDRPVFAAVLSIVIVLVELRRTRSFPSHSFPRWCRPRWWFATYPGATARVVADTVATRSSRRSTASTTCCT